MLNAATGNDTQRVGLVLGAGGTAGGAFISGALAAIEELTGWRPWDATSIVGTSIGALRAARLATPSTETERSPASPVRSLVELARPMPSLEPDSCHRLMVIGRRVGGRLVALAAPAGTHAGDYPVGQGPYHRRLVTVSVVRRRGTRVVTRLADAPEPERVLYASAAVPGVNTPVVIDGREHIDGAVHSTTNADLIAVDTHDMIIVIAPMVLAAGGSLVGAGHRALLVDELGPWRSSGKPALVVVPTAEDIVDKHDHKVFRQAGFDRVGPVR